MILDEKYSPEKVKRAKAAALFLGEPASEIVKNLIDDVLQLKALLKEITEPLEAQDRDFLYTKIINLKQIDGESWAIAEVIKRILEMPK